MCPKMRPVGVSKKGKKGQKLSCVKLAICPDYPRRHRPLKFCVRGHVREVVIYFKFHENRSSSLRAVGGIENRPLLLTRPMAYTTACTTVQAVIIQATLTMFIIGYEKLKISCKMTDTVSAGAQLNTTRSPLIRAYVSTELALPERSNVFYAVNTSVPEIRFVIRRKQAEQRLPTVVNARHHRPQSRPTRGNDSAVLLD